MPVVVTLRFPAGRYHATPWGRHVNEGVPEWPPSPWRLLRALIAVWKRTCPKKLPEAQVRRILEALAAPPRFALPPARFAHTRHYMPWEKKGPQDRTLVFDTFVSVPRPQSPPDELPDFNLQVLWPDAELTEEDRAALACLLGNLSSLGRAESWIEAELAGAVPECVEFDCTPSPDAADPVRVFCPDPATAFADDHYPTHDAKKLAAGKIDPADYLFDCPRWHLCLDTETIHAERWPTVPGARWVNYSRPRPSATPRRMPREPVKPTVAQFLLDGPVLPLAIDTVLVAEAFRRAAMSRFKGWCLSHPEDAKRFRRSDQPESFSSPTLSGRQHDGSWRKDHEHAYYLSSNPSERQGKPPRLTRVSLYAPEGFGPGELAALQSLRTLNLGDERPKLQVRLLGLGNPDQFGGSCFGEHHEWVSATPFVAHRHFKRNGRQPDAPLTSSEWRTEFAKRSLEELLELRFGNGAATVESLDGYPVPPREFRRWRDRHGDDGRSRAFGVFRIKFSEPVNGPLALGYGAHFGLGLFVRDDD